jgi:hypothetical protein
MRKHQEASLTLLENGITFQNGQLIDEEVLLDKDIVGNRSYRSAKRVEEGRPRHLMYLGDGLVTFNDTSFPFPYAPKFFSEDDEILGPAEILRKTYETVEDISEALEKRDERIEQLEAEVLDTRERTKKSNELVEDLDESFGHLFVDDYEPEDVMYDPFPHPDHAEHDYPISWTEGSIDSLPDLSDSAELEEFFEEGGEFQGFDLRKMWIQTESGRLFPLYKGMDVDDFGRNNLDSYNADEDFFKVYKVYHAVGFILAKNDITFKDGVYVTDRDLKQAGVISNTNYKNAWDVIMGRPDTVLPLGNGRVTFNNTEFSLPWDRQTFHQDMEYGDITSYSREQSETVTLELEEIPERAAELKGPADILRASHQAWQEAREISERQLLEALTASGVEVDTLDEENHVDPEEVDHN